MHKFVVLACGIVMGGLVATGTAEGLKGTVKDEAGNPIKDAILWLTNHPKMDTTDEAGTFDFGEITGIRHTLNKTSTIQPLFKRNSISFNITDNKQAVRLDIFNLSGKRVKTLINKVLVQDKYTVSLTDIGLSPATYIVNLQIGSGQYTHQMVVQGSHTIQFGASIATPGSTAENMKTAQLQEDAFDVLHCVASGYVNQDKSIASYSTVVDFVMLEYDTTPPQIKFLTDDTVWCKLGDDELRSKYFRPETWQLEITDNRDTGIDISIVAPTSTSIDTTIPGIHWIRYSAIDLSANIGYASRMLILYDGTITDTDPPVLTVSPDTVRMAVGELWQDTGVTALDAVDSTINLNLWIQRICVGGTLSDETPPTFTTQVAGTCTITYNVIDTHKNLATKVRTFIVSE